MILNSVGQYNECSKNSLVRQNVTVLQMWNIRIITIIHCDSKHQITKSGFNNTATVRLLLRIGHNHKFTDALYRHRLSTAITCNAGCLLCVCMWHSEWVSSVLRPRQHSIVIWETVFTGQKTQPTVSKYWRNIEYTDNANIQYNEQTYKHKTQQIP